MSKILEPGSFTRIHFTLINVLGFYPIHYQPPRHQRIGVNRARTVDCGVFLPCLLCVDTDNTPAARLGVVLRTEEGLRTVHSSQETGRHLSSSATATATPTIQRWPENILSTQFTSLHCILIFNCNSI